MDSARDRLPFGPGWRADAVSAAAARQGQGYGNDASDPTHTPILKAGKESAALARPLEDVETPQAAELRGSADRSLDRVAEPGVVLAPELLVEVVLPVFVEDLLDTDERLLRLLGERDDLTAIHGLGQVN